MDQGDSDIQYMSEVKRRLDLVRPSGTGSGFGY